MAGKPLEITKLTPKGEKQSLYVVNGTVEGQKVELKVWKSAAFFDQLKEGETFTVTIREEEREFNGQTYKDRFISTCNGIQEKEERKKGGGGFTPRPARSPKAEAADVAVKVAELVTQYAMAERRMAFEAALHNAKVTSTPLMWDANGASLLNLENGIKKGIAAVMAGATDLAPFLEGK